MMKHTTTTGSQGQKCAPVVGRQSPLIGSTPPRHALLLVGGASAQYKALLTPRTPKHCPTVVNVKACMNAVGHYVAGRKEESGWSAKLGTR